MNFFYSYKIEYYEADKPIIAEGITYGASWLDVMTHLIEWYGDNEMTHIFDINILNEGGSCLEKKDIIFKGEEEKCSGGS